MATAEVNGITLSYTDSGGSGPVIVLSHGFLMDSSMFDPQVAALTPDYRVITWDQRGFGATPATAPFTYWDSAADLLALLDHLGIERAVLGGMSQGGFVSLRAALKAPERVRALVLIDSQAGLENPDSVPAYQQMEEIWMEQGPGPVQDVVAAIILGPPDGPVDYAPWFTRWAAADREGFRIAFGCLVDRDDITDRIGEISCPVLIIHGTADAAIPMERAQIVRDGLGGPVTFVVVEGASHAANLSHPSEVNAAITDFLRSLDA